MTLLIVAAVLTFASVVISYYLTNRALGHKLVALAGLAGVVLYLAQGYFNLQKTRPRTLNSDQQQRVALQLRQFYGSKYDVSVTVGDPEAEDLLRVVEKSLDQAGWKQVNCAFATLALRRDNEPTVCVRDGIKNVNIEFAPERAVQLQRIASRLAAALTAEGIFASFGSGNVSYQTDAVHILIGRKN